MDRSEGLPAATRKGSQSKLSPILLWILLAAVLLRIVTAVTDPGKRKTLVSWIAADMAATAARAESRPILYDFTAAWCAPCHVLDREGWNNREIAALVNERFVAARIVDRQREEGKNTPAIAELQRRYGVEGFPTLVVASADGREIGKLTGWRGRETLAKFLRESRLKAGP
jgi:thiol:disulfide interchange protein